MRKLVAAAIMAFTAQFAGQVVAADLPEYPPIIEIPDVDYGYGGSFYLRGSAAANLSWAKEVNHTDLCGACGTWPILTKGYGYSFGAGFGYETGDGLRVDATLDYLDNGGLSITKSGLAGADAPYNGTYSLRLRSTLALANVYYDFSFGGGGGHHGMSAEGGAFGYVGAGVGVAFNNAVVTGPMPITEGKNVSLAAAGMVGLGYDFGAWVADVGYRAVYINSINNGAAPVGEGYSIAGTLVNEVRGSLRYRFY